MNVHVWHLEESSNIDRMTVVSSVHLNFQIGHLRKSCLLSYISWNPCSNHLLYVSTEHFVEVDYC